jgi:hypothetical protein
VINNPGDAIAAGEPVRIAAAAPSEEGAPHETAPNATTTPATTATTADAAAQR